MATTKATSSYLNQAPRTVAEVEAEMGLRPRSVPLCKCGSLLSVVTWTCVRGVHCPETGGK